MGRTIKWMLCRVLASGRRVAFVEQPGLRPAPRARPWVNDDSAVFCPEYVIGEMGREKRLYG